MKIFLALLLFLQVQTGEKIVVKAFHEAVNRKLETTFIKQYRNSKNPTVLGYVYSLEMKQAKYKFFPWSKLAVFKKAKRKLESLIAKNPENVHLRYIRLVIQEQTPAILNYKDKISADKSFLLRKLEEKDSSDYLDYYIKKNTSLWYYLPPLLSALLY